MRSSVLIFFLIVVIFTTVNLYGQHNEFSRQLRFIQHMQSRGNFNETLFLLENLSPEGQAQSDSVNYLTGWVLYGLKDLNASTYYLKKVSHESPFFHKSIFFAAYNNAYLARMNQSRELLNALDLDAESVYYTMRNFQLAGFALLDRDLDDFHKFANELTGRFSFMQAEEKKLNDYALRIDQVKNRSPWVAGIMSMAVPGLGKIYAGKTAEGISTLLYVGAMMVTSWDFYNRFGAKNPIFITSATITSIFHIGNIWGSAAAVKRTQNEFNYEMDQRILLDMHVPLRRLFP